jgi:hypothetical protein
MAGAAGCREEAVSNLYLFSTVINDRHPRAAGFLRWLERPSVYEAAVEGSRAAPHVGAAVASCLVAALPSSSRLKYALCSAMGWFWFALLSGLDFASAESHHPRPRDVPTVPGRLSGR